MSVIIELNTSSVSFFLLLLVFNLNICYTFCSCSTVLGYCVLFFFSLFFLPFSFGSFCYLVFQLMYFFLDCVPPTNELIIGIPHFYCMVFYFQSFFLLLLFLKTFIFLSPLFLCSCMLSVFLIRILAIFIIVVLNFWCYISNSFAISDCSPVHHVTSILISKKHGQTVCGQVIQSLGRV